MNIDKQYKKTPNQYLHENMVWTLCSVLLLVAELRGTEGHRSCSPDMWQSCHSVQQPQERGRHLSKGSAGAHGNRRGVMSPLGRACVHEWLRRDTAPLNVTYTLSFIIVSRLLTLSDSDAAPILWRLNDYSRGNLHRKKKNVIIPRLVCQKILFLKGLKSAMRWLMWISDISLKASMSEKPLWV